MKQPGKLSKRQIAWLVNEGSLLTESISKVLRLNDTCELVVTEYGVYIHFKKISWNTYDEKELANELAKFRLSVLSVFVNVSWDGPLPLLMVQVFIG